MDSTVTTGLGIRNGELIIDTSLDPLDWVEFRLQAHRMLDDMLSFTENIRERPVWQRIPDEVRSRFRGELPGAPSSLAEVHDEFMQSIVPFTACNAHPGFMGWVQGGGTPVGMLAEMLAAGLNANVGGRDQIPVEVERQIVDWMRTLFGFPAGASGLFVTGTSMASFIGVVVARNTRLGTGVRSQGVAQHGPELSAYASVTSHGSIARAMDFSGLGSGALRLVAVDHRQRMDLEALARAVASDRAAGLTPFLVAGTAGTVDTGAIDDLSGIADFCAREGLWFHVDGAYGALAMLSPELAPRLAGIERADSLAFDFHKWAQVQYDAGFILIRDSERHRQAFASSGAYMHREERGMSAGSPWPCDLGPDLSRGFRALKIWVTLKVYGADALGATIRRTCELARYLEGYILTAPELELMAPIELNVVCFRYRLGSESDTTTSERCNELNREIVVELQEAGAVAPSTTMIGGKVVIRAAIVNHRTSCADVEALFRAVLKTGRRLEEALHSRGQAAKHHQPWYSWDARVRELDSQLSLVGDLHASAEVALRYERGTLLSNMGRNKEAQVDCLRVLILQPAHKSNLISLGRILVANCRLKAAQLVYAEAVKYYQDDIVCRVNLGAVLLERNRYGEARDQYEAALHIDPEFPQAHGGMYYALAKLGGMKDAELHQRKAFGQLNLIPKPYRGASEPVPVLLLVSSTGGNTPIEKLLDDRVFQTYIVVADFYDRKKPLPKHRLIVNGIGDVDVAKGALDAAKMLVGLTSAPVLNGPSAIQATSRCENASRMADLPGVIAPATRMFSHDLLSGPDGANAIARNGFTYPLLLRAPCFHMGQHFVRVESEDALTAAASELPGEEVLAIEYLDARGLDGCARKYRVMVVDGQLYPLHLAISQDWKIHYFSADMVDRPDHRAEDAGFLADMPGALGEKAMAALELIRIALDLDYGGIDFGLSARGDVLLFEANATMIVQHPDEGKQWDYRRPAVERIHNAVSRMLLTRAGVACA